jgi:hypothetical protein
MALILLLPLMLLQVVEVEAEEVRHLSGEMVVLVEVVVYGEIKLVELECQTKVTLVELVQMLVHPPLMQVVEVVVRKLLEQILLLLRQVVQEGLDTLKEIRFTIGVPSLARLH